MFIGLYTQLRKTSAYAELTCFTRIQAANAGLFKHILMSSQLLHAALKQDMLLLRTFMLMHCLFACWLQ